MTPKERIVEQTMEMFVTQGIKSVRMDDIAQRLGISKARASERNRLRWAELSTAAPNVLERLFLVLNDVMEHSETTSRMMENLRKFYPAVHERLMRGGSEKNRADFREMIEQGIADGLFIDNIDIELAITVLYYTASAITVRKDMILPEGISERSAFTQIVSTFFRGISTAEGARIIDGFLKRQQAAQG